MEVKTKKINKLVKRFNEWRGAAAIWFDAETGDIWLNRYPNNYVALADKFSLKHIVCVVRKDGKEIEGRDPLPVCKVIDLLKKYRTRAEIMADSNLLFMLGIVSVSGIVKCKDWLLNDHSSKYILNFDGQLTYTCNTYYEQEIVHEVLVAEINKRIDEITKLNKICSGSIPKKTKDMISTSVPKKKKPTPRKTKQKAPEGA